MRFKCIAAQYLKLTIKPKDTIRNFRNASMRKHKKKKYIMLSVPINNSNIWFLIGTMSTRNNIDINAIQAENIEMK